jgi:hypothetical protein
MTILRLWLWVVPIGMLVASVVFAVVAALDERWGLLVVMVLMGVLAVALLVFHWWAMYRFGQGGRGTEEEGR